MTQKEQKGRWLAITTGVISVAIALAYLLLVLLLDRQGPLLPPPPEALGVGVIAAPVALAVPPLVPGHLQENVLDLNLFFPNRIVHALQRQSLHLPNFVVAENS